ncbi:uncharacterized protein, partial [Bombus fervidus]|uniref:uncharacterized protein n=1 Tax=Bombus fervidus TaxID=203811 RepID=UPI003AB72704
SSVHFAVAKRTNFECCIAICSGDYESALVLYHRAANLYPRDSSHGVAARRTAATISSCNNPSKALRKVLPSSGERLTAALCPETAAIMANEQLKKSPEPMSIPEVLSYFDSHKSYWKSLPSPRISNTQLARSKTIFKQLNNLAETTLKNLEVSFESGKVSIALKITQELLVLSEGLYDPSRYQIAAYHYLSLIHVAMGRHDRAVCSVSRLIRLSKSTEDVVQICRSLVTLGKVHLSFGHLDAAAKAWEYLSKHLKKPIPVAWIKHEIGRCYLETGKYEKAMEMGFRCVEAATKAHSKKWMLNGRLLLGQSLAKLGRFVESLEELQIAAKITEEEGDTPMLSYIRDLIDQVARALRKIPFGNSHWEVVESVISHGQKGKQDLSLFVSRKGTVTTTVFSQRKAIIERRDDSGNEDTSVDEDGEITTRSNKTANLASTYRECTARSDLEKDQYDSQGCATFRVDIERKKISPSSSSSSLTSFISTIDAREEESRNDEDNLEKIADRGGDNVQEEEDTPKRENNSTVSGRSVNTMATYVIEEEGSVLENVKQASGNEEEDSEKATDRGSCKLVGYEDKIEEQRGDMLNVLRVIEELGMKNEVELLEMLRDMLLSTDEKGRPDDLGNSGDGFRTSRSGADRQNEVVASRSIRTTSLPSSPRKCQADGDFRDCAMPLEFN